MKKTKFSWKKYWEPTPKGIRKIADSLLAGGMLALGIGVITDHTKFAMVIGVVCMSMKIISNFFTDETSNQEN